MLVLGGDDMRYSLFDYYEDIYGDLLLTSDDIQEIRMAAQSQIYETDGECDLVCRDNENDCEVAV